MKRLAIVLSILAIQSPAWAQYSEEGYPFKTEVKGAGKPIILIPGLSSSGDVWQQTVDLLQENFACHVLTLAGFAGQPPVDLTNGYLPVMKSAIETYIKNELTARPVLIGHSLGGFLAMEIAATAPELAVKVVVVDAYPFMAAAYNPAATVAAVRPQALMMKELLLNEPDSAFASQQTATLPTMITPKDKISLASQWSLASDRPTIAEAMFELMTTDLRNNIGNIRVPLLVLGSWYGGKDYGITKEMVTTSYINQFTKTKNCKIKIAATAKHFIMWDDFEWFYNEVDTFIRDGQ